MRKKRPGSRTRWITGLGASPARRPSRAHLAWLRPWEDRTPPCGQWCYRRRVAPRRRCRIGQIAEQFPAAKLKQPALVSRRRPAPFADQGTIDVGPTQAYRVSTTSSTASPGRSPPARAVMPRRAAQNVHEEPGALVEPTHDPGPAAQLADRIGYALDMFDAEIRGDGKLIRQGADDCRLAREVEIDRRQ